MNIKSIFGSTLAVITGGLMLYSNTALGAQVGGDAQPSATEAVQDWQYPSIVDADFVVPYAVIPPRADALIIDSRPPNGYDKGHIVPAVNIPQRKFEELTNMLPEDKSALLVFYCGGLKCPLSHKSAFQAEKLGYTNVKVYAAGYPDWIARGHIPGVSENYVANQMRAGSFSLLVDARPPKAFAKGSVPGAINIPDRKFQEMSGLLPGDKNVELVFFCGGYKCPLSPKSAAKAVKLGYTNVKLFQAGYPAWVAAFGAGTETRPAAATADNRAMPIETFVKLMAEDPDSVYWVDVRDPPEIEADGTFKLKTAMTIPMDDLVATIPTLPKDKPLVFFCDKGIRALDAIDILKEEGSTLEVFFLDARVEFGGQDLPKVSRLD